MAAKETEKSEKLSIQARFDQFVDYVKMELERRGRRLLYTNQCWYEYRAGAWTQWSIADAEAFETTLYKLASSHEFAYSTQKAAIWNTLRAALGSEEVVKFDPVPMIVCNAGTYFVAANKMKKHNHEHFATRRVSVDVDPKAECPKWLAMLERMFDDYTEESRRETIDFLQEWMGVAIVGGSSITNSREMRKGLFLYGATGTGKSSMAEVLIELLGGIDRIATQSLTALGTQFGLQPLLGKAALIVSEAADARTTADSNVLKNLITGEPIAVDRKNLTVMNFRWDGPVLFTTNNLPKIKDDTDALYNRCVIVEFTRQFTKEDVKATLEGYPSVIKYLRGTNQMPGILNWCLDGYDRAVERGSFSIPTQASSASEKFRRKNDMVFDFLKACCVYDSKYACGSEALTIACVEYSLAYHDTPMSVATAQRSIAASIRQTIPGIVVDQGYLNKQQFRAYSKLRLSDTGLKLLDVAATKQKYVNLKQARERTNYRYG